MLAPSRRRMQEEEGVVIVGRAVPVPYQGTVAPIAPHWSFAVRRALASFRPDVVHAHEPLIPSTSAVATWQSPAPVVATFHAHSERSTLFDVAAPLLRPLWRKLIVRIAVSEAARAFLTSRLEGEVRVIPNGVDVSLFGDAKPATNLPDGRRIAWVGRLDPQKGHEVFLDAFSLVKERAPADMDEFEKKKAELVKRHLDDQRQAAMEALLNQLKRRARIQVNSAALAAV